MSAGDRQGFLPWARELDNRLLGRSTSRRGWLVNLFLGVNPVLSWVWLGTAIVLLVVAALHAVRGDDWARWAFRALVFAFLGYAGRSLPRRWEGQDPPQAS